MAITFKDVIQQSRVATDTATNSFAVDPVAGDSIIVLMSMYGDGTQAFDSPFDDGSNTYEEIIQEDFIISDNGKLAMWAALNITTGGSSFEVTVQQPTSVDFISMVAILLTSDSPLVYNNDAAAQHGSDSHPTSPDSTLTPPANSMFFGAAMSNGSSDILTDDADWNITGVYGFDAGMLTNIRQSNNATRQDCYGQYLVDSVARHAEWDSFPETVTFAALVASFSEQTTGKRFFLIPN